MSKSVTIHLTKAQAEAAEQAGFLDNMTETTRKYYFAFTPDGERWDALNHAIESALLGLNEASYTMMKRAAYIIIDAQATWAAAQPTPAERTAEKYASAVWDFSYALEQLDRQYQNMTDALAKMQNEIARYKNVPADVTAWQHDHGREATYGAVQVQQTIAWGLGNMGIGYLTDYASKLDQARFEMGRRQEAAEAVPEAEQTEKYAAIMKYAAAQLAKAATK